MKFSVPVKQGYSTLYYQVEKISESKTHDRWRAARENEYVILESNRPLLLSKGLKRKRPLWKIIEGNTPYANVVEDIKDGIMSRS